MPKKRKSPGMHTRRTNKRVVGDDWAVTFRLEP